MKNLMQIPNKAIKDLEDSLMLILSESGLSDSFSIVEEIASISLAEYSLL